ncbi:cell wall metabolism sensor histidine kinase WalK [Domibacillus sp. A3M-37]|uniref:ATP-binding protein n=1 Tax=Domibacillus sp. A3M-37 TaxID=2962037 RepID=UPI0020B7C761|nr:ATP-binding protein [Domibacillus sp. A3M-37]MCP3763226.1 cell wall metabolism sensor histidine kinase WalK [Domibacillus sp. A3M-37]
MKIWRSVVGKLWITILLLVSFVLAFLTILLLEFFENYHILQVEQQLENTAEKIAAVIEDHENEQTGLEVAWELVDEPAHILIAENEQVFHFSPLETNDSKITQETITTDPKLSAVFDNQKKVEAEINIGSETDTDSRYENSFIVGVPFQLNNGENGAVFIYQSLEVMKETTEQTTKLILIAAGIAIILTTIFAFFLSTRVTAPLRKMREAATELSQGNFDTKVPILTHDEIGALATSFNRMAYQLKGNIHALNQEKEQLSSILSSMADGVITLDQDGDVLITNPPARQFLHDWNFEKKTNGAKKETPTLLQDLFKEAVKTETEQEGELTMQGRSYVIIVSPLYNADSVRGAVTVVRDMTEERRLDKLREDFIANVSHELRTPISMMQGYSEAIVDDIAATEEEKREIAQIIHEESLRMGRLVNELLDLARIQAGHITLNKADTALDPFLQRVTNKFQGLAKEKNIFLSAEMDHSETVAAIDEDRIEQVLTNLIDNALRHTPENGHVTVVHEVKDDFHLIQVEDSGAGIPEDDLPFVFERFYKADKARTRGRAGTGLGLSIAKNIVHAHGGTIKVQSRLGHGTVFFFTLPRRQA